MSNRSPALALLPEDATRRVAAAARLLALLLALAAHYRLQVLAAETAMPANKEVASKKLVLVLRVPHLKQAE